MKPTWIAIALVAGVVAGGVGSPAAAKDPVPEFGFAPVDVPGIDDADRLAAMLSIHAHARWPDPRKREVPVIGLNQAVTILQRDVAPAGTSRRRRAIAKLAAFSFERDRSGQVLLTRFKPEITALGGDLDLLETRASQFARTLPPKWIVESIIQDWLVFMTPACPWESQKPTGAIRTPPPAGWFYNVNIPRRVSDIARAFDPQKWDDCNTFFPETYTADVKSTCCPYQGNATDCSFTPDNDGNPPAGEASAAGRPMESVAIFETYCSDKDGDCGSCVGSDCDVEFRNLLCVDTGYDINPWWHWSARRASEYKVTFDLASWLRSEVLGYDQEAKTYPNSDYKIIQDDGAIKVVEIPPPVNLGSNVDWSKVSVDKALDLNSLSKTVIIGQTLFIFQDELGGQIAEQACCIVPVERWSPFGWPTCDEGD